MATKVKITQVKSTIRRLKKQKYTLAALGLHGIGKSVVRQTSPVLDGMLAIVSHMVIVEDAE